MPCEKKDWLSRLSPSPQPHMNDGIRSWQNVVGILFEASVGGAMLAAML